MVNLHNEEVLTFSEAARIVPRVNGNRVNRGTVSRWAKLGIRGVRLDSLRLGGRYVTSREALDRFLREVADQSENTQPMVSGHV